MKNFIVVALVLSLMPLSIASAVSIAVDDNGGGNYSLFLAGDGTDFDSIGVAITPIGGSLANPDSGFEGFRPRNAGEDFSFINAFLSAQVSQGGEGFSLLDITTTESGITFQGGPLGASINTTDNPGGRLFLANVLLPAGVDAQAVVNVVGGGQDIAQLTTNFVPEPTSMALLGLGLVGFVARRRRS